MLPDPGYPDYLSAVALADAKHDRLPLLGDGRPDWDAAPTSAAALYLNYPSNPIAACAREGVFEEAIEWAHRAGAWVLHDFAYGDLVFDGRKPATFLAVDGAREVGFELFSMSKSYGMAGWRLGFAVGNAEIVARIEDLQNHQFGGIFMPLQEAAIAALTGPQDSVEERRAIYEARRDRSLAVLEGTRRAQRGHLLRLVPTPGGTHVRAPAGGAPHRARAGRGLRRAGPRLGAAVARDAGRPGSDLGLERLRRALTCLKPVSRRLSSSRETAARATPSSQTLKRTWGSSPK